jgi:Rps23 Pro-64 3,4-dihydroxylase Tpa1-like proline 4-hydroxylase
MLLLEEFFAASEVGRLWSYAMSRAGDFVASEVVSYDSAHRDSDGGHGGPVSSRELTFVYYGHREPLPFTGGELRMIDGDAATIVPHQNSIVFFPSHYLHEVMPIYCPSGRFEDSRLTFNGWLHR